MTAALVTYASYFIRRLYDDTMNFAIPFSVQSGHAISFLGVEYESTGTDNSTSRFLEADNSTSRFLEDFQSRIFLPYREGFEPIVIPDIYNITTLVSDRGWGCTIRSTQMLVAQSLISLQIGRDFRSSSATDEEIDIVRNIVWRFADTPDAELSIHRIVRFGAERLDKPPGTWFGPSSAAVAVRNVWLPSNRIGVLYFPDGSANPDEISANLLAHPEGLILLFGHRLGLHSIDLSIYKEELMRLFQFPMFQGMVGGDSRRAFYIPAVSDNYLYYLDPHVVYPALTNISTLQERMVSMRAPFRMPWERLDPQISLAFSLKSRDEAEGLFAFMRTSILFTLVDIATSSSYDVAAAISDDFDGSNDDTTYP